MKKPTLLLTRLLARRACLWAALGLLAAVTFGPRPVQAAVTEAWVHRYSNVVSNSNDEAVKLVRDAAGDVIVTGFTDDGFTQSDILTIKYSGADGSVLWQQRYNGPGNGYDYPSAVAVDDSGNVVVAGASYGANFQHDYYTAKYAAADGALLWEKRYNGPANDRDVAQALAVDGSGNVAVTGSSWNGTNGSDYYTAKYAVADGALLWEKRYNGPGNGEDGATAVGVDEIGNVVVTGYSKNGAPNYKFAYYTAKYAAADGALLWERRYSGPADGSYQADGAHALAVDGNGNVVVTGFSASNCSSGSFSCTSDFYTAKYAAADGTLLWEKRYNGSANGYDGANAVAVDDSGNVVVTGYSHNATNTHYYTAKYAGANGALLWENRHNGLANDADRPQALAVDGSGNAIVTGFSWSGSNYEQYTAKYAEANGRLLWEQRYTNGGAQAVAVDGSGSVVVTGFSLGSSSYDYYTAKYAAEDGTLLWEKRYNGMSKSYNYATAVVVDGSGNVVVTGNSATIKFLANGTGVWTNNGGDALAVDGNGNVVVTGGSTAKYAAANGALLWEKRYTNSAAFDVVMDGSGNVVVAGFCYNTDFISAYYTAKYAAADGALLWEKRYNGPANRDDSASAVAVDGSGNVVVTGHSYNSDYDADYYTAKYAAADGALLWEKRYDGPAHNSDFATALAVDGSGNVVVTGGSYNGSDQNTADYYTAKYAAADGALLWEKRYNGPVDRYDVAWAVAVDASGNVLVTGFSGGYFGCDGYCADEGDFYTAKYAAADGVLLWEKRYNGPANLIDVPRAVAVDGSGNVVVTGVTDSDIYGYGSDYYTAKYAAADGALLWEKRYDSPANWYEYDAATSLALGPNGMVAVTGVSSGDYATVVYRDDVYPISIALIPAGVRLRFTGIPGRSYMIERAPAVTGPWAALNTQTAPASGLLEYLDVPPPLSQSFYRTAQPQTIPDQRP